MALELLVNGVDLLDYVTDRSLEVKGTAYQQTGVLSFRLEGAPGSFAVSVEHEVILQDGATRFYGGKVRSIKRHNGSRPGWVLYYVNCQDFSTLLNDDVVDVGGLYAATLSDGDDVAVNWLITTFGTKGVTVGAEVQELRATMPTIDFTGLTLAQGMDAIAKLSGGAWYVDYSKKLHYFATEADAAAFGLSDSPNETTTFGYSAFQLPDESTDLKNAVYVIPGGSLTPAWYTDAASIATYGRREAVLKDERVTLQDTMDSYAATFLAENATPRRAGSLVTWKQGLRPGMTVQITNADHGLAAETFRIQKLTTSFPTDTAPRYQVEFGDEPLTLAHALGKVSKTVVDIGEVAQGTATTLADLSVGGANLVPNSSFESGSADSWEVGSQWAFGFASSSPFHGLLTAAVIPTGTATGELLSALIPVDRTDDWWVSFWSYLSAYTAGNAKLAIREYDGTGDPAPILLATTTITLSAAEAGWTRHARHFGPNDVNRIAFHADTTHVQLAFHADTTPTLTWEVDAVQVERGNVLTAYAPRPQELVDGQVTETQIGDLAITTPKLAAGSVVAGKLAAGIISAEHISAEGIAADSLTSGTLRLGGISGSPDVLVVYDANGDEIGRWSMDGLLITDANNDLLKMRLANGILEFSEDGGTTWTTAISGQGISADAIRLGTFPGGHNAVPNSGFEIADFNTEITKTWTDAADWQSHLTSTDINVDDSTGDLKLTSFTY